MNRLTTAGMPALIALVLLAQGASGTEVREPRLDELHTMRPAAVETMREHIALAHYSRAVEAARLEAFLEATAAAEAAAEAEARVASTPGTGAAAPDSFLACTKDVESHGDYGAVSSGGTYRGAYQFQQSTWDSTAREAGRADLVGVDPAAVPPGDQDAMAAHLYDGGRGISHWGGRCG